MAGNRRVNPKRDANEPAIVEALEAAGARVVRLNVQDVPDLLVYFHDRWTGQERVLLLEVKTEKGKLSEGQEKFIDEWRGCAFVVRTPEEALKHIGRIA